MTVRDALALAQAAGFLGLFMAGSYAVQVLFRRAGPGEDKFGLEFAGKDSGRETYEGEIDGARVRVYGRTGSWDVTLWAETGSRAEFFAHKPKLSFDRPLTFFLRTQRRLDNPPAFGGKWRFYGTAPAVLIVPRLPAPTPAWDQLELARGVLRLELDFGEGLSRKSLEREAAVFRQALAAISASLV